MIRVRLLAVATIAVLAIAAPRGDAAQPLVVHSSAAAFNVNITISRQMVSLPNAVLASDSGTTALPSYKSTVTSANGKFTLVTSATTVSDTAAAIPYGAQSITGTASSSDGALTSTLTSSAFGTLIAISGTGVKSKASFHVVRAPGGFSGTPTVSATIGKLTINAPLLGINNLTFAGAPTANQVLYQNAAKTVTVTLNAQRATPATATRQGIEVDAVDVHFAKSPLGANLVNGDIEIGSSIASGGV